MNYLKLSEAILSTIETRPTDTGAYNDLFSLCREWEGSDFKAAHARNKELQRLSISALQASSAKEADFYYGMYRKTLLFDAPHEFDSFLLYMELDRAADKRFYQPRRHYLRTIVQGYQDIIDGNLRLLTVSLPKRGGKQVSDDTPVLTRHGWKNHGNLTVGDEVVAPGGEFVKVLQVHPPYQEDCLVTFSNGERIHCHENHEWLVYDKCRGSERIMETHEIEARKLYVQDGVGGARYPIQLPKRKALVGERKVLPVQPYTLGAWLGDGSNQKGCVTHPSKDQCIIAGIEEDGYTLGSRHVHPTTGVITQYVMGLRTSLRSLGMCYYNKRTPKQVPEQYLTASYEQRLMLLAGLIDTDGTKLVGHRYGYSTTDAALKDSVMKLISTFGWECRAHVREAKLSSSGIQGRLPVWTIHFVPTVKIPCRVERKRGIPTQLQRKISVRSVERVTPKVGRCITVEGGLYCIGHSMLPTHNSQLGINFVNMLSGRNPDRSSLMEGTGDDLVKSFHNGCLEYLLTPNEYSFYDVFPEAKLVQTNADTKIINLKSKSRFPTVMCRSIDSRQVGLSEASNVLYLDDCVEGREEAKNRQRLDSKWETISGDIMGRAIEGTPMVFTGTRYSLYDPIGRVQDEAQKQGWAWRAIEIPALDPVTDESNYEYEREGKKVFTTGYFREQREMLSAEQFESEFQQQPFEAKGLLFDKDKLNYFYELPVDLAPDAILCVADTAEKGSDSVSMPVAAVYGTDVYIVDVVFDNSSPDITKPQCAKVIMNHKATSGTFESNNAGEYYARDVAAILKEHNYPFNMRTKRTISNKQTRIELASDGIIKRFFFKHPSTYERGCQYWDFMRELTTYTRTGKVPHDDAPDSLSLLENQLRSLVGNKPEIISRPF